MRATWQTPGLSLSAFHYYHTNVFLENLKLDVEIFHVEVLLWSDLFFS